MSEGQVYKVVEGAMLLAKRNIVRFRAGTASQVPASANHTKVPFNGFDGQALAGTGALVFEGEIISETRH